MKIHVFRYFILPLASMFFLLSFTSCKKYKNQDPAVQTTAIKYKIDPMNNTFVKISYRDASGNIADELDWEKFTNGERTISISNKPFDAKIQTTLTNPNNTTIYYNLLIYVNDSIKGYKSCSAPPQVSSFTSELSFTVN